MAEKSLKKLVQEAVNAVEKYGQKTAAAKALGIPPRTLMDRVAKAASLKIVPTVKGPEKAELTEEQRLAARVKELETQLRGATAESVDDNYVKTKIIGLTTDVAKTASPEWALRLAKGKGLPGVPVAMWSDWHWGEVVAPSEIGGVNEFNIAIAHRRLRRLVERTVDILKGHVVRPEYPGIVVNLGGDMVTGDIHDELSQTNDAPIMPVVLDLFGSLKWAISTIADEFGRVLVPCVPGNHGRNTRKPHAKQRAFTNFDWLLYQFLCKAFEDDERVEFVIPDSPDCLYTIYGTRHVLTHGDQFRGGDGIIGHMGPVIRGRQKKLSRNAATGQEFDVMVHGHFHTYRPSDNIIGNGSLKGYDEYAAANNFGFEVPQQALWFCHPTHGITQHWAIKLESDVRRAQAQTDWVQWRK
jgi:hypothetical protein